MPFPSLGERTIPKAARRIARAAVPAVAFASVQLCSVASFINLSCRLEWATRELCCQTLLQRKSSWALAQGQSPVVWNIEEHLATAAVRSLSFSCRHTLPDHLQRSCIPSSRNRDLLFCYPLPWPIAHNLSYRQSLPHPSQG